MVMSPPLPLPLPASSPLPEVDNTKPETEPVVEAVTKIRKNNKRGRSKTGGRIRRAQLNPPAADDALEPPTAEPPAADDALEHPAAEPPAADVDSSTRGDANVCWICYQGEDVAEMNAMPTATNAPNATNAMPTAMNAVLRGTSGPNTSAEAPEASEPLIEPCRCKGSVRYVHAQCLLSWLERSADRRCPQCRYAYRIEEQHDTFLSRVVDSAYFTTVMTYIIISCCYLVFHLLFTRATSHFNYNFSSPKNAMGSFTRFFTQIEIFCGVFALVYLLYRTIYVFWYDTIPRDSFLSIVETNWRELSQNAPRDVYSYPVEVFFVFYKTCQQIIDRKKEKLVHKSVRVVPYSE